ncbi:MAG: MBOAT family protein [Clostridia bacterium]|nr:MBOAT family protein [Clostridia bacterium]
MVFSSFTFLLLFMPVTLLGCRLLPGKARMPFLLAVSLLFYAWGNPLWQLLLLWSMGMNYGGVLLMMRGGRRRRWVLIALIVLNLMPLFWFKYAGFFADTLMSLTGWAPVFERPVLPVGISFFTFQAMSYVIDVWRGEARAQRNFLVFGVYLSLFPQLVAGPIVRYVELEEQLLKHETPSWEDMREGLRRFCFGLGKKVLLADAVGRFWGQMNGDFTQAGAVGAWLGLLAFSFQIFFDFSGYSDMALGLGRCMGFRFPENFDRPYRADSVTEFWRRWHMTLSGWFRAYVYIPLGGNRVAMWRRDLNLLIVWALTGLWHGAGWHFVLWGVYFAVLLVLEKHLLLRRGWYQRLPRPVRQMGCFFLVMLGWGIFSGFGTPLVQAMAGGFGLGSAQAMLACAAFAPLLLLCCAVSFLPEIRLGRASAIAAPVILILCLAALAAQGYAPFVYFQF